MVPECTGSDIEHSIDVLCALEYARVVNPDYEANEWMIEWNE